MRGTLCTRGRRNLGIGDFESSTFSLSTDTHSQLHRRLNLLRLPRLRRLRPQARKPSTSATTPPPITSTTSHPRRKRSDARAHKKRDARQQQHSNGEAAYNHRVERSAVIEWRCRG